MDNGTTQAEAEVCPPGTVPTGCAVPINNRMALAPAGCVVVRREVVWALGGAAAGAILMFWMLQSLQSRR